MMSLTTRNNDKVETLDHAERWMRDGLAVVKQGDFFQSLEVDMAKVKKVLNELKQDGIKVTYTHVFVRAVAIILSRYPDLHELLSSSKSIIPHRVDIGLSIAGKTVVAPVMIIEDAGRKTLLEIANEVIQRVPQIRHEDEEMHAFIRKWGWIVPVGMLRRWIIGLLMKQLWFRRKGVGTFQITSIPEVDQFVPFLFANSAILGVAGVRDRVIAVNGQVEVRPATILSCCADHKVWDGKRGGRFLQNLKTLLESDEIAASLQTVNG